MSVTITGAGYIGDFPLAQTVVFFFNSHASTGGPTSMTGSPVVSAYSTAGGATQFTTGITLEQDYDSVTGLNKATVDMSTYGAGEYYFYLSAGTVGVISAVGQIAGQLSINSRSIATVQADTDNIQLRLPAALTTDGNMKTDVLKVEGADPTDTITASVPTAAVIAAAVGATISSGNGRTNRT